MLAHLLFKAVLICYFFLCGLTQVLIKCMHVVVSSQDLKSKGYKNFCKKGVFRVIGTLKLASNVHIETVHILVPVLKLKLPSLHRNCSQKPNHSSFSSASLLHF